MFLTAEDTEDFVEGRGEKPKLIYDEFMNK